MERITISGYRCDTCGKVLMDASEHDEYRCKADKEARDREHIELAERIEKTKHRAVSLAVADKAISVLLLSGLKNEARDRADSIFWSEFSYTTLHHHVIEDIIDTMITEAAKAVSSLDLTISSASTMIERVLRQNSLYEEELTDEIAKARMSISRRYSELKRTLSFSAAYHIAAVEWLNDYLLRYMANQVTTLDDKDS